MHLKSHQFGLAGGLATAFFYTLDSLWYAFWPESAMSFWGFISHNFDFAVMEGEGLTWASFFAGLVAWSVTVYVCCAVFAWMYNKLAK